MSGNSLSLARSHFNQRIAEIAAAIPVPRWLWIVFASVGVALPAALPLWQVDYFAAADSALHLWRVFELDRALHQGILYPRWAPDLAFGYGYPVFNFYPPLAYYAAETLHVFGFGFVPAIKIVFSLCLVLGSVGAFLFARDFYADYFQSDWQRDAAGLLAAAAFIYAPYFLIDLYLRGAIAEMLGMAILPLYFWSLRRMVTMQTSPYAILAGVIGAVLLLSHNLTALFAAPIIAGYLFIKLILLASTRRARVIFFAAISGAITLALSAFYWLPATTELALVYIGNPSLTRVALRQTLFEDLRPLSQVIQLQWLYRYPQGPFPLGLASLVVAIGAILLGAIWLKRASRLELGYFVVVAIAATLALTDFSRSFWLALPSLWVIQFSWRLTVLVVLACALASGLWVVAMSKLKLPPIASVVAVLVLVAILITSGLLNLRVKDWDTAMPASTDIGILARYEANTGAVGMSSMNEYLPVSVANIPVPTTANARTQNTQPTANPAPRIQIQSLEPNESQLLVIASAPTSLSFGTFYYPDWRGWIDDVPAPLRSTSKSGLLTIDIPAGEHRVRVLHDSLPLRDIGMIVSGLLLVALLGLIGFQFRRGEKTWRAPAAMAAIVLLIFAVPQVYAFQARPPHFEPTQIELDKDLRLVASAVESGDAAQLKIDLLWQVKQTPGREIPTRLQLIDSNGQPVSSRQQLPRYGTSSTRFWYPNVLVRDEYDLRLPEALAGGDYTLQIARGNSGWSTIKTLSLNARNGAGSAYTIQHPLDARVGDAIHLVGFNAPSLANIQPGDSIPLTLFWRADQDLSEDYSVFVHVVDRNTKLVAQDDSIPNNGFAPTLLWMPGQIISDLHTIELPNSLVPGVYQVVAGLYRFADKQRLTVGTDTGSLEDDAAALATFKIRADTAFTPANTLNAQFGSAIQLHGFTLTAANTSEPAVANADTHSPAHISVSANAELHLNLEWRARQAPQKEYTVFVHLLDAQNNLVRQQDNPPLNGGYKTNIWDAGERVVDSYGLDLNQLPPGEYRLMLGMYASEGGERLPAQSAQGVEYPNREIPLAQVTITP